MATQRLFRPLKVGHVQLEHRAAMAPLTRLRADDKQAPTPLVAEYYAQRGSAPGTLLVSEATGISPRAGVYPHAPGLWSREQIEGWKAVTSAVHAKGSFIFAQLWALGRVAPAAVLEPHGFEVHSAGDIPAGEGYPTPKPMTKDEIKAITEEYVQAAKNAIEAGFDGVELHGANGYLIDQFWQDVSNNRSDEYGGSIENRARFGLDITKAVIAALDGDSKKVAMRLSPYSDFQAMRMADPMPQFSYIAQELRKLNLAYLSLVESRADNTKPEDQEFGDKTHENDAIYKIWGTDSPIMLAGGFTAEKARRVTEELYPDHQILIAFGRYFISTPDIVARLKKGSEFNKYDRPTFYGGTEKGYTDYPFESQIEVKA